MKILHVTSLYPNICKPFSGRAVKKLIDSVALNKSIENQVIHFIPFAFFPISLFREDWKCYSQIKQPKSENVEFLKTVVFPKSSFRIFSSIYEGGKAFRKVKKYNSKMPTIVHCHTAFIDGYCGRLINEKLNIPYVLTVRREIDFENNDLNDKEKRFTLKNIEASSMVIAPSIHLKKKCLKYSNKEPILVPNGIDAKMIISDKELIQKQHDKRDTVGIITVASLDTNKSVDIVIRCFSKLLKKYGNFFHLDIVGSGPLEEELKELVRIEKISSNVTFHGQLTNQEVIQILDMNDIFFLPSKTETFGLEFLEALARGLPIIGRKNQGIDGIAIHGVHGFFEDEIGAFYEALETLSTNKHLRDQMGKKGVELAKKYTWEKSGIKLAEIYKKIELGE